MSLGSATRVAVSAITNRTSWCHVVAAPERGHHLLLTRPSSSRCLWPLAFAAPREKLFAQVSSGSKPATSVGFFEASGAAGDCQFPDTAPAAERMIGLWMNQSLPPYRNLRKLRARRSSA